MLTPQIRLGDADADFTDNQLTPEGRVRREVLDLYRRLAKGLLRYILCIVKEPDLAQEVVQEAFLRYYECRLKKEPAPMGQSWIYRVARNYAIDQLRANRTGSRVDLANAEALPDDRYHLEQEFDRLETISQVSALLAPRELECLQLRFEGFKYREIGKILGIESCTVGAILARAFKKIRTLRSRNQQDV